MSDETRTAHANRAVRLPILLIDLVFVLYACVAVYHSVVKPALPGQESLAYPVIVEGINISNPDEAEFFMSAHAVGDSVRVSFPGGTGAEQRLILVPHHDRFDVVLDVFFALLILSLGTLIYLFRMDDPAAVTFHLATVTLSAALLGTKTMYVAGPPWLGDICCRIFFLSYVMIPVIVVHFTFLFPAVRWPGYMRAMRWMYAGAFLLAAWGGSSYLHAAAGRTIEGFHETSRVSMILNGVVFLVLLFGVGNFVFSYRRAAARAERKKIRWILYGLCIGTAPFLFFWVLPYAVGRLPLVPEYVFKLFLLLIPLTFAISIMRYHVMDIDLLINRSAVYVLIAGALLGTYAALVALATVIVGNASPLSSPWIPAAAAILIAMLFDPLRARTQRLVDRAFFRVEYNYREALRRLVDEMKETGDTVRMSELIVQRVDELVPVERIGFFLVREGNRRTQLLAHRGFDLLETHGVRLQTENLKSELLLPVALDDGIEPGQRYESGDTEVFLRWGIALVIPMMTEEKEILGFLVLGPKKSQVRFTVEDVDLLTTVTLHAGLSIRRVILQEKLFIERESGERLRELSQMKSYFVSSVSHDLKTPLTSIRMFAELLRTKKHLPASRVEEYLRVIEGESERLTRLINSVLDFALVERGVKEYHFSDVSIDGLVGDVLQSMEYQLSMGHFTVRSRFGAGGFPVYADPGAVTEASINLVSNAMKYSSERKEIEVATFRQNGSVAIRVTDHGIGIASAEIDHIFEPFYRTHGGKESGAGGAGLGLALVKHIVEAHRGRIEVKSSPGEGSEFTLYFPERRAEQTKGDRA